MHRKAITSIVLLLGFAIGCSNGNTLPGPVLESFQDADEIVLYSLEPHPSKIDPDDQIFHGQGLILGETVIADAETRRSILTALESGVREHDGPVPSCFDPRHGIRIRKGEQVQDLVICFECVQIHWYQNDERAGHFRTSPTPQPVLDAILKAADVPLAAKPALEQ